MDANFFQKLWVILMLLPVPASRGALAQAAGLSNLRQWVVLPEDSTCLTANVIPNSIEVTGLQGHPLDTLQYEIRGNCIIWHHLPKDSVRIRYRLFPFDLRKRYSWVDSVQRGPGPHEVDIAIDLRQEEEGIFPAMDGLDYRGNFARGVSLGNSQNAVLNSNFNLQMQGKIAEDLRIKAAITDENIPVQPEGNTQQLREFDKIYIQLTKGLSSLTMGDYELKSRGSHFIRYFKKLQGVTAGITSIAKDSSALHLQTSFAIPRGRFVRQTLKVTEGNQGPYSLRGQYGERFLIVQSGTERVFLDGRLLRRGADEDYVIDYNRGILTFTPKNLITKDSRVIVEFEYSDQRYQRNFMAGDAQWEKGQWKFFFNVASEQDSKLSGGVRDLSKEAKLALAQAGDDLSQAFVPGVDTVKDAAQGIITYELIDTLGYSNVLRYSTDKTKTLFRASFSEVGPNRGNYIIGQSAANGRVYEWVAPAGGIPQGNYEPVVPLVAPVLLRMFSVGAEGKAGKYVSIKTEVSLSENDANRLSALDDEDNTGLAAKTEWTFQKPFGKKQSPLILEAGVRYEWVTRRFRAFNPFRATEFARDWNLPDSLQAGDEHRPAVNVTFSKKGWGRLRYDFEVFRRTNIFDASRHRGRFHFNKGRLRLLADLSWTRTAHQAGTTGFLRPKLDASFQTGKGRVGFIFDQEDNRQKTAGLPTLATSSAKYDYYKLYWDLPQGAKWNHRLYVSKRFDYAPFGGVDFSLASEALDLAWQGNWKVSAASKLDWQLINRQLDVARALPGGIESRRTWLGRVNYRFDVAKGVLAGLFSYELGSGQAPKLEYNYLQVDPGQGSYTWIDRNQDSIPQLDEFEIAPFPDQANYIRISVVTNEFVPTRNVGFRQSLRFQPQRIKKGTGKRARFLKRFSTQTNIRINRKALASAAANAWNPLESIADTSLVSSSTSLLNSLFFDRGNPKFEWQAGHRSVANKSFLTSGGESREKQAVFTKVRLKLSRNFYFETEGERSQLRNRSELFAGRNYDIHGLQSKLSLTHIFKRHLRNVLSYQWSRQRDAEAGERSLNHELKWEATYSLRTKRTKNRRPTTLRGNFSLVQIQFEGAASSPAGFAMLNGLRPGSNLLWGLSVDKQLTGSIILSLLYNGRRTGADAKVIHWASMQARAVF